jgi:hypothetical protein
MATISLAAVSCSVSNSAALGGELGKEFLGARVQARTPLVVKLGRAKPWVPASASDSVAAAAVAVESETERAVQRLKGIYEQKVVPSLKEEFKYGNIFEVTSFLCVCVCLSLSLAFCLIIGFEAFLVLYGAREGGVSGRTCFAQCDNLRA